ncbi:MAG: 23S rRNA (uracil(1939)-C(5))-methyltransferase RlmD [Vulcanimicrobiaceae bacterium]
MTIRRALGKPPGPAALRVGTDVELGFSDLLANGQAVGRADGLVIFCFGPLPQERARVRVTAVKPKYAVAEMSEITLASPLRAQPFCGVFGACGGCQVQHLAYAGQLAWKRDVVRGALARIGGLAHAEVRDAIGMADPRGYRNKMSLVIEHRFGRPQIGFYQQRSHDIVPIDACPVVTPQLNAHIERLNAACDDPATAPAFARALHVVARSARATGQSVVSFTTALPDEDLSRVAAALLERLPGAVGLTNSYDPSSANAVVGRKERLLAGQPQIEEEIAGVRYRVSGGSFFQVNVEILERIFEFMKPGLTVPRRIVDLYSGAGTFALYFAWHGNDVLGIEESPGAIAEANENAELNGLAGRVAFRPGRVEDRVREREGREALRAAQIVFLDPPRKGCDETVLEAIAAAGTPNVWYLSCDPATLARDLKFLAAKGYALGVVQPFDMFPYTGHVETFVTLYRERPASATRVEEAFENVPVPQWPADDDFTRSRSASEYPEFVIR